MSPSHYAHDVPASIAASPSPRHNVIDLTTEDLRSLAGELMAMEGRGSTPFGTYLLAGDDPSSELPRFLEQKVFADSFGLDRATIERDHGDYEPATLFICVLDHRRRLPVGAMRVILPGLGRTKTFDDIESLWHERIDDVLARTGIELDLDRTWDLATMTVDPSYRSGLISQALHQAGSTTSVRWGTEWHVSVLDVVVFRLLQLQLRRGFAPFTGVPPQMYAGSLSLPVHFDVLAHRSRLRTGRPELYETLYEGRNLEPVVSAPDWDAAAELVDAIVRQGAAASRSASVAAQAGSPTAAQAGSPTVAA